MTRIFRSVKEPIRAGLTWEEMWRGSDNGLITSWERGREKAIEVPELAEKCLNGELPVLVWKGGLEKAIKGEKLGSLFYLAMWQGLRGEDLSIELVQNTTLSCSKTNVLVTFTPNLIDAEKEAGI